MKTYEKVINAIAGIGFLALVPVGLAAFHIYQPLDFLQAQLGFWGSATFLVIVFYALTVIRILFGHAELYAPLVIGVLSSFLFLAAAVPLSFMGWYWSLVRQVPFLADTPLLFILALVIIGLATLVATRKKFPLLAQLAILVLLPFAVAATLHYAQVGSLETLLRLPRGRVEAP